MNYYLGKGLGAIDINYNITTTRLLCSNSNYEDREGERERE